MRYDSYLSGKKATLEHLRTACGRIANSSALNPNSVLSEAGTELCLQNNSQICGGPSVVSDTSQNMIMQLLTMK